MITDKAGLRQSISKYLLDPNRRREAMAVESPITTPKKADTNKGIMNGLTSDNMGQTFCLFRQDTKVAIMKNTEATKFFTIFSENALPCQFLSQNIKPRALEIGERTAGPRPGVVEEKDNIFNKVVLSPPPLVSRIALVDTMTSFFDDEEN